MSFRIRPSRVRAGALNRIASVVLIALALVAGAAQPAVAAAGPAAPTGLTVTVVSAREVELRWNPVPGATAYEVWWGDVYYSEFVARTTQTTFRHTQLGPGGTYSYAVRTATRKALSPLSAFVEVTTPPEAPTLLQAEVLKADEVQLSWQPGAGADSYAITEVTADGTEVPVTVLSLQSRYAVVRTVADTHHVFRIRGVHGSLLSLEYATVEVTTPPREPSVINHESPSPVPAGPTELTFSVSGTQTLHDMSGTLAVSVDGGPVTTVPVQGRTATLAVDLEPGTHTLSVDYSGDGAYLPSHGDFTFFVAVRAPTFAVEQVDPADVPAAAAADVTCDGRTDLVSLSTRADGSISLDVRPGQQDGTLGAVRSTAMAGYVSYLATGDLNRDGCGDVAVLGTDLVTFTGAPTRLGNGTRVRADGGMSNLALHDLTGDGRLDAVVNTVNGVTVLPGNGRGGFDKAQTAVPELARFAVGDLDGDGRLDLVTGTGDELAGWFRSATGQFVRGWTVPGWVPSFTVDDLTGDRRAEVMVPDGGISLLSGLDGSRLAGVPGVYWQPTALATGDVDGDGLKDIVIADGNWSIGVALSSAGGPTAMQYQRIDPYGISPRSLLLADVSGDGRTDAVLTDYSDGLLVARQS